MYKKIQTLKRIFNETFDLAGKEILAKQIFDFTDLHDQMREYYRILNLAIDQVYMDENSDQAHHAVSDLSKAVTKVKKIYLQYKEIK